MEAIYYAVGVIGSIRIVKDLFKPKEKIENRKGRRLRCI